MGSLALAAGALDDAAAWVILAIVLGSFTGSGMVAVIAAVGGLLYAVGAVTVVRPTLVRFEALAEDRGSVPPWMFSILLAALAAGAWFTDLVGIHSVFGAFILGAVTPNGMLSRELQSRIEPLTSALLVPLFFVYSGLNSSIGLVDSAWLWAVTVLAFVAACAGKGVACFIAARVTGASTREALSIATLMNARGLMELILLNIGLQRGLITPTLFTILVMMTIGTTLMAGPLFSFINRGAPARAADGDFRFSETS
jgi:Kef-type K+ transport system membrane component KefB